MDSISTLNDLLTQAKTTHDALVPFNMEASDDNRAEQKRTYNEDREAETELYKALIRRSVGGISTGFRFKSGETGVIGTVGMLLCDSRLNYAEEVGSKYCMSGVRFLSIDKFCEAT